jgi:hypothetical protein
MGTAGARGAHWAAEVIRRVGRARPWPPFEGKARAIALRKVADLGGDVDVLEARALHCWERAKETYEDG